MSAGDRPVSVTPEHVAAMADHLLARDLVGAKVLALQLLGLGIEIGPLLTHLIAPAQAVVGERWHRNEASIADEHGATAVADALVTVLTSVPARSPRGPHVVVACAEGEWHLLAARLVAETLPDDRYDVTFLGPSMPAAHLGRFLEATTPDVLAVSCSTALAFEGVASFVNVAHGLGVPVLAGGRALGADDHRASLLGADWWAPDALAAVEVLRRPPRRRLPEPTADAGGAMELALRIPAMVEGAMDELGRRYPPLAGYTQEQLDRTREDLGYILEFAQAAILMREDGLFGEFLTWLTTLLVPRGVPTEAVRLAVDVLGDLNDLPALARLLDPARDALLGAPGDR